MSSKHVPISHSKLKKLPGDYCSNMRQHAISKQTARFRPKNLSNLVARLPTTKNDHKMNGHFLARKEFQNLKQPMINWFIAWTRRNYLPARKHLIYNSYISVAHKLYTNCMKLKNWSSLVSSWNNEPEIRRHESKSPMKFDDQNRG